MDNVRPRRASGQQVRAVARWVAGAFILLMGDAAGLSAQIVPTLSSLDPASLVPGDGTSTVIFTGSGFTSGSTVTANGVTIPANYVSATSISVPVPPTSPSDVPRPLAFDVAVTSPTGLRSNPLPFILNPVPTPGAPTITGLPISSMLAGNAPFTAVISGTGFTSDSVLRANDIALPSTFVSPTALQVVVSTVPASVVPVRQLFAISVVNGGASSNHLPFALLPPDAQMPRDPSLTPTDVQTVIARRPSRQRRGRRSTLMPTDVQAVIAQAVTQAISLGSKVTVAVTDREGNVLGVFRMAGAPDKTVIGVAGKPPGGLQGTEVPATFAAISKAGTASFFATNGNAFTTRTAGFIIQEHFPTGISFTSSGPLFGVQFSSLPCTDVKQPPLPLGLSGDPGGVPLYKDGVPVGGIGVEGDGQYTVDTNPRDDDLSLEEIVAVAGSRGFEAPASIRATEILVNGIRLPFINGNPSFTGVIIPFSDLPGTVDPAFPIRSSPGTAFQSATLRGVQGTVDPRFFPPIDSPSTTAQKLTASDVETILAQGAQQAEITRAAIRMPLGDRARVNIAVVDAEGRVLGLFRTQDSPVFGVDVSVQKARSAAFFSNSQAASLLGGAGFSRYVDQAGRDGLRVDGSVAFSDRALGFLSRPLFPDGIDNTANGPFSVPLFEFSPFNDGLQLDLVLDTLARIINGVPQPAGRSFCGDIPNIPNGLQIFPGSVPLYKEGRLVGGIGVSGDGVDQDDIVAAMGSRGFEAPPGIRADQVFVRGVRLPYVKFPRQPDL